MNTNKTDFNKTIFKDSKDNKDSKYEFIDPQKNIEGNLIMTKHIGKNEEQISLLRVGKKARDTVKLQAVKNSTTIRDYVEQLIFKAEKESQDTEHKESEVDKRDTDPTKTKIRFEGYVYIEE